MKTNIFTLGNTEFLFFEYDTGYQYATTRFTFPHYHPFPELFIVLSGETKMFGDSFECSVTNNKVCIMPPFLFHGTSAEKSYKRTTIPLIIKKIKTDESVIDTYSKFSNIFFGEKPFVFTFNHELIGEIIGCLGKCNPLCNEKMKNILSLIFIDAFEKLNNCVSANKLITYNKKESYYQTIIEIDDKISSIFVDDIPFKDICEKIGLTTRQVSRLISAEYKSNIKNILHDTKMKTAKYYLNCTEYSVEKISELLGYSSRESFSTTFKKHYGVSPINYKERNY